MTAPLPEIALVDDDPSVRTALQFSLELEGFRVVTYESAEALIALDGLARAQCLIIDYRLPGADGIALVTRLRDEGNLIPAILITSNPSRSVIWCANELDARIVEKPLLDSALLDILVQLARRLN